MTRIALMAAVLVAATTVPAQGQSRGSPPQQASVGACQFGGGEVAMMSLETNHHGTSGTDMNGQRWYFSHGVPCWKKIYPIQR